jgi:hypothetical protein
LHGKYYEEIYYTVVNNASIQLKKNLTYFVIYAATTNDGSTPTI